MGSFCFQATDSRTRRQKMLNATEGGETLSQLKEMLLVLSLNIWWTALLYENVKDKNRSFQEPECQMENYYVQLIKYYVLNTERLWKMIKSPSPGLGPICNSKRPTFTCVSLLPNITNIKTMVLNTWHGDPERQLASLWKNNFSWSSAGEWVSIKAEASLPLLHGLYKNYEWLLLFARGLSGQRDIWHETPPHPHVSLGWDYLLLVS